MQKTTALNPPPRRQPFDLCWPPPSPASHRREPFKRFSTLAADLRRFIFICT